MKNQKLKDDMPDALKVHLLALNQLDIRKAAEKENPDKYHRHYQPIEDHIMRQLKTWNFNVRR